MGSDTFFSGYPNPSTMTTGTNVPEITAVKVNGIAVGFVVCLPSRPASFTLETLTGNAAWQAARKDSQRAHADLCRYQRHQRNSGVKVHALPKLRHVR